MGDFARFQEPVWDRFFEFVLDGDEGLTDSQVDEELRRRSIDVTRAFAKVQQAMQSAKAKAELEAARKSRPGLLRQLEAMAGSVSDVAIEEIRRFLTQKSGGKVQGAFFRKLESASSEDDLRSLLDDLNRLDALSGGPIDAGTEGEQGGGRRGGE